MWLHGNEKQGCLAAHKCPKCGGVMWKKWLVPVEEIPKQNNNGNVATQNLAPIAVMTLADVMTVFALGFSVVVFYFFLVQYGPQLRETIGKLFTKTVMKK